MNNINNHLLIAMPNLKDSIFNESVILICEHNNDGSMGFIINKPIDNSVVIKNISNTIDAKLYFGGPVSIDSFIVLHDNTYQIEETKKISKNLHTTTSKNIINDINKGIGPEKFIFNLGYSGWSAGQLDEEIKNGDWIIVPNPEKFIFDIPDDKKWNFMINKLGLNKNDSWDRVGGQA